MDDKPRLNPFSISNILASKSSRENKEREVTTTIENERDKDIIEVDDNGDQNTFTIHPDHKTTRGDLYDWETESTDHDKSLTEYDRKYSSIFARLLVTVV